jgi:Tfp pilus assembly protein PilN
MDARKGNRSKQANMLDLNILPDRYRRRRLSLRTLRLWFIMLAFAGLIYPSYVIYSQADEALKRQEMKLAGIQMVLDEYEPLVEEKDALLAQIEEVENQSLEIESVAENAVIQEKLWSEILESIVNIIPEGVDLVSIKQRDNEVLVVGLADDRRLPPSFVDALLDSGIFGEVRIEYMVKEPPEETESEEIIAPILSPVFEFEIMLDLGDEIEEMQ